MTAAERFDQDEGDAPLVLSVATLEPESVFVRTLTLPTSAPGKAAKAVRLQLDRLSPAPPTEVFYALAALGGSGDGVLWAVAFARRSEVVRICDAAGRASVSVEKTVAGRSAVFTFRTSHARFEVPPIIARHALPTLSIALATLLLLWAIDLRLRQDLAQIEASSGAAELDRAWRVASDRDLAVRAWMANQRMSAAELLVCGAQRSAARLPGRQALTSASANASEATLTFVGSPPGGSPEKGVTLRTDGAGNRFALTVASPACAESGR